MLANALILRDIPTSSRTSNAVDIPHCKWLRRIT